MNPVDDRSPAAPASDPAAETLLEYWFGPEPDAPAALAERMPWWFGGAGEHDAVLAGRFGALAAAAVARQLEHWAATPRGRLALILLLDQLPRNLYRGTAAAFAGDAAALRHVRAGLAAAEDARLARAERLFFYMPLQHAEDRAAQALAVERYAALAADAPAAIRAELQGARRYAELHRDIVERFGRFPHRNRALGREPTAAERAWLEGPDAVDFGQ